MILGKFRVVGHSMSPKIPEGREVLVSSIPYLFFEPRIGDIVAFWHFDRVLIKRIRDIKNDNFFLKGDNQKDSYDSRGFGFVQRKDIIGKVIRVL